MRSKQNSNGTGRPCRIKKYSMGVKGLYNYLKQYRNDIDPRQLPPKRIGVDAMSLLYKHRGDFAKILILLQSLREAGHRIFFVFDGKPPVEKEREIQVRKNQKSEAQTKATVIQTFLESEAAIDMDISAKDLLQYSLGRLQNQSWHMTRDLRRAFQEELWIAEIPYVKSVSEADDVLVDLVNGGKLDVVLSTDMDYLLSGVQTLWVPTTKGLFQFEELSLDSILRGEGLTEIGFLDAGLLCGTEERHGAQGIPCIQAFTLIRHYGCLEGILDSAVKDPVVRAMFPDMEAVIAARATAAPNEAYSRIRPDHLIRVKDFLDSL